MHRWANRVQRRNPKVVVEAEKHGFASFGSKVFIGATQETQLNTCHASRKNYSNGDRRDLLRVRLRQGLASKSGSLPQRILGMSGQNIRFNRSDLEFSLAM